MHDAGTAEALLDAAERIVEVDGLDALTVRRVAEEIDASTRAVYSTLGSKDALVGALGVRAFDVLAGCLDALPLSSDPTADLIDAGVLGFRQFALGHPVLFQIGVQLSDVPPGASATFVPAAERALERLHLRIRRVQEAGGLGDRTISDAAWEFHALCEGLASVELRACLPESDVVRIWRSALSALVTGWRG